MSSGTVISPNVYKTWNGANGRKNKCNKYSMRTVKTDKHDYSPSALQINNIGWDGIQTQMGQSTYARAANAALNELDNYANPIQEMYSNMYQIGDLATTAIQRLRKVSRIAKHLRQLAPYSMREIVRQTVKWDIHHIPAVWLEFNFVAKPAVLDFETFLEVMDRPMKNFTGETIHGFAKDHAFYSIDPYTPGQSVQMKHKVNYKYSMRYKNPNEGFLQETGFGSFIGSLWDLVPWSWAVDYFVNASQVLENLNVRFNNIEFDYFYADRKITMDVDSWVRGSPEWWNPDKARPYSYQTVFFERFETDPHALSYQLNFEMVAKVRQLSYLLSAIALNLRGMKVPGRL